jgi:hypothetical protein
LEAQAREVALREALAAMLKRYETPGACAYSACVVCAENRALFATARTALAAPADDAALREFVQRCLMPLSPSNRAEVNEKLDAVLRGSR